MSKTTTFHKKTNDALKKKRHREDGVHFQKTIVNYIKISYA